MISEITKLIMIEPNGSKSSQVSIDQILHTLVIADAGYWKIGSGNIEIERHAGRMKQVLGIMCRPSIGFHFNYSGSLDCQMLQAVASTEYTSYTSLFVGGDYLKFPVEAFVPLNVAHTVINDFVCDGKPSNAVKWLTLAQSRFRTEDDMYGKPY
jgi:hypothetical protein